MEDEKKLTSDQWYPLVYPTQEVVILDPDGWNRQNWKYSWYEELITLKEFNSRVMMSTCLRKTSK